MSLVKIPAIIFTDMERQERPITDLSCLLTTLSIIRDNCRLHRVCTRADSPAPPVVHQSYICFTSVPEGAYGK
jgi:hypothetical protein